jgi:hypothetical protein
MPPTQAEAAAVRKLRVPVIRLVPERQIKVMAVALTRPVVHSVRAAVVVLVRLVLTVQIKQRQVWVVRVFHRLSLVLRSLVLVAAAPVRVPAQVQARAVLAAAAAVRHLGLVQQAHRTRAAAAVAVQNRVVVLAVMAAKVS